MTAKREEGHRDFVDAVREVLGLAPLYRSDEGTSPVIVYPDVGARRDREDREDREAPELWGGTPAGDGWFNQTRKRRMR